MWNLLKVQIDSVILDLGLVLTFCDTSFLTYPILDLVGGLKWLSGFEPEGAGARRLMGTSLREIGHDLWVNTMDARERDNADLAEQLESNGAKLHAAYSAYAAGKAGC